MQIRNCGRGIHRNEIAGVDRLRTLPPAWYAFTNLDLALGAGTPREVDVIVITDRRVLVIDLKNWGTAPITGIDGRWYLDGEDMGPSPVAKVLDIKRQLFALLKKEFESRPETKTLPLPKIDGVVALTGRNDRSGIPATERNSVFTVDELIRVITDPKRDFDVFKAVARDILSRPLTEPSWKDRLTRFFNGGNNSPLDPGRRKFDRYVPEDAAVYEHPLEIYREYEAREQGTPPNLGTLRLWDFAKVKDTRFQTEEGRSEIVGRERRVFHWLRDRSDSLEKFLLPPRVDDVSGGVDYWEVYDRRRRLKRLSDWTLTENEFVSSETKVELARQLLAAVAEIHKVDAAHLDLGPHSIWLDGPTTVRLSHLFAARHPSVQSLGDGRYNFLASAKLPEDILKMSSDVPRRDVYLLGIAVHQIIFGKPPEGEPPEWKSEVDPAGALAHLHDWFAEALDVDPSRRFSSARNALERFNFATIEHPTPQEVRASLEKFKGKVRSQMALVSRYPMDGDQLKDSDRVDVWRSTSADGESVLVKMWKQAAWGDIEKEGRRVLSFLETASNAKIDNPPGVPHIRDVFWLSDAFALVQDWTSGNTLLELFAAPPARWNDPAEAISILQKIELAITSLHEAGFGHGDLKPDNVVLTAENEVVFIDFLDFAPAADGEIQNSAYSAGGDRFQRDRFAVLKIAEEILAHADIPAEIAAAVAKSIDTCRTKEPRLSTLMPFAEALAKALTDLTTPAEDIAPSNRITVSVKNAEIGLMEPDEGLYFIRTMGVNRSGPALVLIRGASEELEVRLDDDGVPRSCTRRQLTQTRIAIVSRHEKSSFKGSITVGESTHNDLTALVPVISNYLVERESDGDDVSPTETDDEAGQIVPEEEAEERLAEEIALDEKPDKEVDVPLLWRELIKIENELTIDARAIVDSAYDRALHRHKVAIELESGNFDFNRNDTVGVQRQTKGVWRRIGELDLSQSTPTLAVIEPSGFSGPPHGALVEEGQRLRFISHFETESLKRRTGAVERILAGQGRAGSLVSIFDPRSQVRPTSVEHQFDEEQLKAYKLNPDQATAFRAIVANRPIGLLQGPPGTGKTRFIAALAHYALTKGLARNVLLSSQAHEAVNTAAEALLKLFRQSGGDPSILRVAVDEQQVSDQIRGFHTPKVEQALKDRFAATFVEKMSIAGKAIGLNREAVNDVVAYERQLLPLAERLQQALSNSDDGDPRSFGLLATLEAVLGSMGLPQGLAEIVDSPIFDFADESWRCILEKHTASGATPDKLSRLLEISRVGRDFVSSASRFQRSFEPFLAGTRQIVAGTCVGLGRTSLGVTATSFDLVIIDEAARCTASELLVPLQAARWAVLVGDQAQLEPQHKAEVVNRVAKRTGIAKREIKRSDFERVFEAEYGRLAGARLATQYRMLKPIGELVSEVFYPALRLNPGRTEPELAPDTLPSLFDKTLAWIDTSGMADTAFETKIGDAGRLNRVEADSIIRVLEDWKQHPPFVDWLVNQKKHPFGIGIICMYAAQRDFIRKNILRSSLAEYLDKHIKVGTVDSYQGKENPIVFLSLVRNNHAGRSDRREKLIREGFLVTPNRINVAASRAMDRLVVVGSLTGWRANGPMAQLASRFSNAVNEGSAVVHKASEILTMRPKTRDTKAKDKEANG